jgi:hypothetical protein
MLKNKYFKNVFFLLLLLIALPCYGQNNEYKIESNKLNYYGDSIVFVQDSVCILNNEVIEWCFAVNEISKLEKLSHSKIPSKRRYSIYSQAGIVSDNAFPLSKNDFYYKNTELFGNSFVYGLDKNVQFEVGNSIFTSSFFESPVSFFASAKVVFPIVKNAIQIGFRVSEQFVNEYVATATTYLENNNIYAVSSMLTFGDFKNNLTVGYKFENFKLIDNANIVYLNGQVQLSDRKFCFLDHFSIINGGSQTIFGFRKDSKNYSFSYGLMIYSDNTTELEFYDSVYILPYLGVLVPFSK